MLKTLMIDLFGTYTPITYTDADSVDVIASGSAGIDWVWIAGFTLFAITLFCVFRMIGGTFKK